VATTGSTSEGTRAKASGTTSTASPRSSSGRGRRRQRHLRLEPRDPLRLTRPQAGAQPPGVIRVGHIDRIHVHADPRDHLGHRPRRDGPISHHRTRQPHRRCRVAQQLPAAVGDANTIDHELEPSPTPTSTSPTASAPTRRATSAIAGYSTAQRPAWLVRVRRRTAIGTTESVIRSSVSIAAPAAASPSAAAYAAASAGARPAKARSCSAARITVGCRFRAGPPRWPRAPRRTHSARRRPARTAARFQRPRPHRSVGTPERESEPYPPVRASYGRPWHPDDPSHRNDNHPQRPRTPLRPGYMTRSPATAKYQHAHPAHPRPRAIRLPPRHLTRREGKHRVGFVQPLTTRRRRRWPARRTTGRGPPAGWPLRVRDGHASSAARLSGRGAPARAPAHSAAADGAAPGPTAPGPAGQRPPTAAAPASSAPPASPSITASSAPSTRHTRPSPIRFTILPLGCDKMTGPRRSRKPTSEARSPSSGPRPRPAASPPAARGRRVARPPRCRPGPASSPGSAR
jgi:hypothetical protein